MLNVGKKKERFGCPEARVHNKPFNNRRKKNIFFQISGFHLSEIIICKATKTDSYLCLRTRRFKRHVIYSKSIANLRLINNL